MHFFNRKQIFIVRKIVPKLNPYDYWISKTVDGVIFDKRFLRQELFALKNQFIQMDPIFIYYNNLKLEENKQFTIELSNEDLFLFTHFTKNCLIMELNLKKKINKVIQQDIH